MSDLLARFKLERRDTFGLDIDLTIPEGTTAALLGPNGSGKSTLVAALSGLVPIHEGQIRLGETVFDDPERNIFVEAAEREIGVVFQDYLLFPTMSVRENIAFAQRSQGTPRSQVYSEVDGWISTLGLNGLAEQKPATLSGGEAQRVALARALLSHPSLLLLDEPFAALDVQTRSALQTMVKTHLERFAGPRLFITHDPREAFFFADQIYIIEDGSISQSGTPYDIRLRPLTQYAADIAGGWSLD